MSLTTPAEPPASERARVVAAAAVGTVFEWYDFFVYGTLADTIGKLFFPDGDSVRALLASLALFGVGFAVRPFGAVVFGRLGDLVGRKHTFLVTIVVMGAATAAIGCLPTFASIGMAAPVLLLVLRVLQGLALGGEYGGAATYVAEHAPPGKRGLYTSWVQTTATLGLLLSLLVIGGLRAWLTNAQFVAWGWRVPFLVSLVLLAISVWIRLRLQESPEFARMKAQGRGSVAPLRDSFCRWPNLRVVLQALFGVTAGQGVVWYTGHFYVLQFLTRTLQVDAALAYRWLAIALVLGTPGIVFSGWLSDRIGRRGIVLGGFLIAALSWLPLFHALTAAAAPGLLQRMQDAPVVLRTPECRSDLALAIHALPDAARRIVLPARGGDSETDRARSWLAGRAVPFTLEAAPPHAPVQLVVAGQPLISGFEDVQWNAALWSSGWTVPARGRGDPPPDALRIVLLLTLLVAIVTFACGPITAYLVELFPTRIRYTSLSLPYHLGNGWFGGFLPLIAAAVVAATGDIYAGLWYPIVIALGTVVVGALVLPRGTAADAAD